jgi:hypothetical protein
MEMSCFGFGGRDRRDGILDPSNLQKEGLVLVDLK